MAQMRHCKADACRGIRGHFYLRHHSQSFNVLPLDQVTRGLSPQPHQGGQKTLYHP